MLVQDFLGLSAKRFPDKIALVCDGARLTYADVDAWSNRLAQALISLGVQRGDRVAICLPNSVEAVIAIFATLKMGGVFVVVNPSTKQDKLVYILNNCRASALFATGRKPHLLQELYERVPSLGHAILGGRHCGTAERDARVHSFDDLLLAHSPDCPDCASIDQDLACLIYTSGTTGEPKGVMSGHSNVVFATESIIRYLENRSDDIVLSVLPLSFDYGLYQVLMVFRFGGTLVLERSFAYPSAILKRMEVERVTGFPGVPTIFAILLQMDLSSYDLACLRYLTNTAAALPAAHIIALRSRFPEVNLFSMYGQTECKRTLYLPPDQLDRRPGSVGRAIPGTEVWIEDQHGRRLGPGAIGELVVRGSHVMRGYWEDPEATEERYRPGPFPGERLLYTDDLFKMDEDGFFYFVARRDDIIKTRGEKVAPKEVENVLFGIQGVTEAAVIGVPDPILGQAVKAFVVLKSAGLTEKDILRHCRAHLEDFMVPKCVEMCTDLPKTTSGKVKKTGLE
jgi:amino acid adenylation domain-containing protein